MMPSHLKFSKKMMPLGKEVNITMGNTKSQEIKSEQIIINDIHDYYLNIMKKIHFLIPFDSFRFYLLSKKI